MEPRLRMIVRALEAAPTVIAAMRCHERPRQPRREACLLAQRGKETASLVKRTDQYLRCHTPGVDDPDTSRRRHTSANQITGMTRAVRRAVICRSSCLQARTTDTGRSEESAVGQSIDHRATTVGRLPR